MFEYLCESDEDLRAVCKIKLILKRCLHSNQSESVIRSQPVPKAQCHTLNGLEKLRL